jgi:hypothetical protein
MDAIKEAKAFFINMMHLTLKPFWEGSRWSLPDASGADTEFSYQTPTVLDYDHRGLLGFIAWAPPEKHDQSAPSIDLQTPEGRTGQPLVGDKTFRLHVPANGCANQYG